MSKANISDPQSLELLQLGARTTAFYWESMKTCYAEMQGQDSVMPLTITPTNFDEINQYLPDQFDRLVPALQPYIEQVTSDRLIIPNITLHETLDKMSVENLVHPVTETIRSLQISDCKTVLLVGSKYSMQAPYLKGLIEAAGIKVVVPTKAEQDQLDIWRKTIYNGQDTVEDIEDYIEFGASPRATIDMFKAVKARAYLRGNNYVSPLDIALCIKDVLRHRIILSYEALVQDITTDDIIQKVLKEVVIP